MTTPISVINIGSVNIDHIYRVPHLVNPGETLASQSLTTVLGGKGANQSVALARAGASVLHVGKLSAADRWASDYLAESGVDTRGISLIDNPSGHAIIQVDDNGENSIILHGGANQALTVNELEAAIELAPAATHLLLQNECNLLAESLDLALTRDIKVVLNPAPMTDSIRELPLSKLSVLIVNEGEAMALAASDEPNQARDRLAEMLPDTLIVLTLGGDGAMMIGREQHVTIAAPAVDVVDTTGAGDTFVGYFVASLVDGLPYGDALHRANRAASIAVTRPGAAPSIPLASEVTEQI